PPATSPAVSATALRSPPCPRRRGRSGSPRSLRRRSTPGRARDRGADVTRRIRRCLPPRASRPGAGWRAAVAASGELLEPRAALCRRLEEKSAQLEAANRDLAAREARLQAILDHEPECVKVVAADGTLLEINPAG